MELDEFSTAIKAHADAVAQRIEKLDQKLDRSITDIVHQCTNGYGLLGTTQNLNPLTKIASDQAFQQFRSDAGIKSASMTLTGSFGKLIKSVVGDIPSSTNNFYSVAPVRDNRLGEYAERRLSVFDVLPTLLVGANTFEFNRLDGYLNAADYQDYEGAQKAQASMPTELVSVPITTIAHWLPLSEQVLADVPALQQQASTLLRYGVEQKAAAEIICGNSTGKISGLFTEATPIMIPGGTFLGDAVASAITALEAEGWQPNLIIMNPADWNVIRTAREDSGNGAYLLGQLGNMPMQSLWGIPVITDPACPSGSPLVLDTSQTAILDRQSTRIELGRIGNQFITNEVVMRAEARLGLAVFSKSAVLSIMYESD